MSESACAAELPQDALALIFRFLSLKQICFVCAKVCKSWRTAAQLRVSLAIELADERHGPLQDQDDQLWPMIALLPLKKAINMSIDGGQEATILAQLLRISNRELGSRTAKPVFSRPNLKHFSITNCNFYSFLSKIETLCLDSMYMRLPWRYCLLPLICVAHIPHKIVFRPPTS